MKIGDKYIYKDKPLLDILDTIPDGLVYGTITKIIDNNLCEITINSGKDKGKTITAVDGEFMDSFIRLDTYCRLSQEISNNIKMNGELMNKKIKEMCRISKY